MGTLLRWAQMDLWDRFWAIRVDMGS
jgi:hypothetical protein